MGAYFLLQTYLLKKEGLSEPSFDFRYLFVRHQNIE